MSTLRTLRKPIEATCTTLRTCGCGTPAQCQRNPGRMKPFRCARVASGSTAVRPYHQADGASINHQSLLAARTPIDWPMSQAEKRLRVLRLYENEVQAADDACIAHAAVVQRLQHKVRTLRRLSRGSRAAINAACRRDVQWEQANVLLGPLQEAVVTTVATRTGARR